MFESLRKKIDDVVKNLEISPALTNESAANSLRIMRLAARARREYDEVKRRRRGLDFDDLLVKTRDLLAGDPDPTGSSLASRDAIEFVLVDEFQDTDRIQSEILRRLGDSGFFRGRMFVVGDTKQSIYRFRGAEPAIFDRWRGEFPEAGPAQPDGELPQRSRRDPLRQRPFRRLLPSRRSARARRRPDAPAGSRAPRSLPGTGGDFSLGSSITAGRRKRIARRSPRPTSGGRTRHAAWHGGFATG